TLNVQKAYDVQATVENSVKLDTSALTADAIKGGVTGATTAGALKDGKVYSNGTDYYVEVSFADATDSGKNGFLKVDVNTTTGAVTVPAAAANTVAAKPAGVSEVTEVQGLNTPSSAVQDQLTAAGVSAADAAKSEVVKMSYTDKNGKTIDGGFGVKVGDDIYAATKNKDGSISINATEYTDKDGNTKTALNQLGGVDGKTEVVTIDGKTYNASKAAGHDFKAQPELAEAAATTTENPLQKIDAALAQVDALRSDLGAVQNRFNSAITNLGNTVNNLSSARSRIEDSDYATEVSNMSRAQILQQAGTSVLAQANQVPQNVLSLLR
ncbi:flagellin FliC, partial [Salmonella enterica subsp. enterica serovar Pretoria]|nr:flagellin FliC [Salmonella enterica subsp. enterica serovar Pretoria]